MKNETIYSELIGEYLSGNISKNGRKKLFAWVEASSQNKVFFEEMVNLWSLSERYDDEFETDTQKAWNQLNQKIQLGTKSSSSNVFKENATDNGTAKIVTLTSYPSNKTANTRPFYSQLLRVAAVFLIVVGIGALAFNHFWSQSAMMAMQTDKGEREELLLPDGSKVWLNENTSFSYTETAEKREVFLEGEAFFDVQHLGGKTFEIFSGDTKVLVVGTSFNVRAYKEETQVEVTVEEGIVKVSKKEEVATEKQIVANESIVFDKKKKALVKVRQEIPNAASWKKKSLTFGKNTTLREVISSFERYYNIEITVKNQGILNCDFTQIGTSEDPKLEEMMAVLEFALDLTITKKEDGYEVDGTSCQ